jgi:hypothetical protein
MQAAIDNVWNKKMSVRQASGPYSVPKSSLHDRLMIPTSSPFKIKLEEKIQAKIDKADRQRKMKETRGKNCLNKSQKTKSHNASK